MGLRRVGLLEKSQPSNKGGDIGAAPRTIALPGGFRRGR